MLAAMPELPEVEHARRVVVRALGAGADALPLTHVVGDDALVVAQGPESFARALVGARLVGSERRGKSVLLRLRRADTTRDDTADVGLFFHLGMNGHFVVRPHLDDAPAPRFARWSIATEKERVTLVDKRRLGRAIAGPWHDVVRASGIEQLGPDALSVQGGEALAACFVGKGGRPPTLAIKVALMDQTKLAGLGNIHAAEALFHARLHPDTSTRSLGPADWEALARGIETTLSRTLAQLEEATELVYVSDGGPNPFAVYGKGGAPCGVCGHAIERAEHGGRGTYFCPHCQPSRAP